MNCCGFDTAMAALGDLAKTYQITSLAKKP
jgi:hypothetical protein